MSIDPVDEGKKITTVYLSHSLKKNIKSYQTAKKKRSANAAIEDLLSIGYQVWEQAQKIETPEQLATLKRQVEESTLVDEIRQLPMDELEKMTYIMQSEVLLRRGINPLGARDSLELQARMQKHGQPSMARPPLDNDLAG